MWKTKACPKCGGDVFLDWELDTNSWYEQCLQCSYRSYLPTIEEHAKQHEKRT